jgi:polyisoprenoid-binding protein YceI
MRRILTALVAAALVLTLAARAPVAAQTNDERAIDGAKSSAEFSVQHIFVSRVTGTMPIVSGAVALTPGDVIPISVNAVLDATKLRTDEPDRDASLTSPDYFDTKAFPTWTFVSTKIVPSGAKAFAMDGLLTMHGVTQPEHLDVTVSGDATLPVYHAVGHVDRRAFGMKGTRLDPVIGTIADVTLEIAVRER